MERKKWTFSDNCSHRLHNCKNNSFHVVDQSGWEMIENGNLFCNASKTTIFIVKYSNLWLSCGCRGIGCLNSIIWLVEWGKIIVQYVRHALYIPVPHRSAKHTRGISDNRYESTAVWSFLFYLINHLWHSIWSIPHPYCAWTRWNNREVVDSHVILNSDILTFT